MVTNADMLYETQPYGVSDEAYGITSWGRGGGGGGGGREVTEVAARVLSDSRKL